MFLIVPPIIICHFVKFMFLIPIDKIRLAIFSVSNIPSVLEIVLLTELTAHHL